MRPFAAQRSGPPILDIAARPLSVLRDPRTVSPSDVQNAPSSLSYDDLKALVASGVAHARQAAAELGALKRDRAALDSFLTRAGLAATPSTLAYWRARVLEMHTTAFLIHTWAVRLQSGLERYASKEDLQGKVVVEMPKKRATRWMVPTKVQIL